MPKKKLVEETNTKKKVDEWVPEDDTKLWKKYDNDLYVYNQKIPEIEYKINSDIIKNCKAISFEDDMRVHKENKKYDIYRIIKIYDDDNYTLSYTKNTILFDVIIRDICYQINKEKTAKLDKFCGDDINKLTNVKYKLLAICRAPRDANVRIPITKFKQTFEKEIKLDNNSVEKYFKYVLSLVDQKKYKKEKYYVQKICQKDNDDKKYIFGSFTKIKSIDIDKFVESKCIGFDNDKLKCIVIKEVDVYVETEGLLYVDGEIKENDSINNGLNKCYFVLNEKIDMIKKLFMMVQYDIMRKECEKNDICNGGFIACIDFGSYKYIYSGYNQKISNKLEELYQMKNHCEKKYEKIVELLKNMKYSDINVYFLEKNIDECNLNSRMFYHLDENDEKQLLNYADEQYATQKDLNSMKALVFASKFKK